MLCEYYNHAPGVGVAIIILLFVLVITVLSIVGLWKVFEKAGYAGWKSLIPIYNAVILYKIGGFNPWLILLNIIPFIGGLIAIVMQIMVMNGISRMFNKGVGFTIGLIFLPFIFLPVLGFDDSVYDNPEDFVIEPDIQL